jgi:hypothetical protein
VETKYKKQKQLVLCNLKAHIKFKETQSHIAISVSKFSELRPNWCDLAGAHGTHTPQNMKLMMQVIERCS